MLINVFSLFLRAMQISEINSWPQMPQEPRIAAKLWQHFSRQRPQSSG